jgi:hypothetical protein
MEIIVNHLTRMKAPRICIAGIESGTSRHVRPTTGPASPLTRSILAQQGGPFRLGAVLDLGPATPQPSLPETEDHRFQPRRARLVRQLDADEYAQELYGRAHEDVETIFGPALARHDWNYAVDQGTGDRSLGILLVQRRADLTADESFGKPRLRLRLNDSEKPAFLSVADLRFWEADHATVKLNVVEDVRRRMRQGVETILMLGLARAFKGHDEGAR